MSLIMLYQSAFKRLLTLSGLLAVSILLLFHRTMLVGQDYYTVHSKHDDSQCSAPEDDSLLIEIGATYPYCSISRVLFNHLSSINWSLHQSEQNSLLDSDSFDVSAKCQEAVNFGVDLIPIYDFKLNSRNSESQSLSCKESSEKFGDIFTGEPRKKVPRIFDLFYFVPTDLDVILIRMYELNDSVDYFVILESELTERGHVRTMMFEAVKNKYFGQFLNKIIYLKLLESDFDTKLIQANVHSKQTVWYFENKIRFSAYEKLKNSTYLNLTDFDLILSADTDEIPFGDHVSFIKNCQLRSEVPIAFATMLHHVNFYWLLRDVWASQLDQPTLWIRSSICSVAELKRSYDDNLNNMRQEVNTFARRLKYLYGGHHMTWRGTALHSLFKMCSMCETGHYDHELMDLLLKQQHHRLQRELICSPKRKKGFVDFETTIGDNKFLGKFRKFYGLPKLLKDYPNAFPYLHPRVAKMCS